MNPPRVRQWRLSAERGSDHKQQPHFPHTASLNLSWAGRTTPKGQVEEMAIQAHVSALPRPSVPHHLGARASVSIEFSMESTANLKLLAKTAGRPHPQVQASPFLPLRGSRQGGLTWGCAAVVLKLNGSPVLWGREEPPPRPSTITPRAWEGGQSRTPPPSPLQT